MIVSELGQVWRVKLTRGRRTRRKQTIPRALQNRELCYLQFRDSKDFVANAIIPARNKARALSDGSHRSSSGGRLSSSRNIVTTRPLGCIKSRATPHAKPATPDRAHMLVYIATSSFCRLSYSSTVFTNTIGLHR
jgi:hypothetical protein